MIVINKSTCASMDFRPVCLRVTFCDVKMLVSVSPFKTVLDLKKEVTRVYHLHHPGKTEQCKRVQDSSGYLACDDYQIGLIFKSNDSVFALTAQQPVEKYSHQWKSTFSSSKSHRTDKQQCMVNKQSHVELVNGNANKMEEHKKLDKGESDEASETDCSTELIPQVLEGNKLTNVPKPTSVDTHKAADSLAKNVQNKSELNKKKVTTVFTDSSLSDSDSDTTVTAKAIKGGGVTTGGEPKSTPKKKTTQEQNVFTPTGLDDKMKYSIVTRKGQKFELATDASNSSPQAAVNKKLKTKRKHPSVDAQGMSSEKKSKKRISKVELELASTSSQSVVDNAKLWTD